MFDLKAYLPILLMFIVAAGFAVSQIVLSQLIGPKKRTPTKLMPYECGKDPVGSARERFSVKFYLVAMVFVLSDIELIFLVPWAVVFKRLSGPEFGLGTLMYVEMMLFIALLFVGFVYIWKKGILDWSQTARQEALVEAELLEEQTDRELRRAA